MNNPAPNSKTDLKWNITNITLNMKEKTGAIYHQNSIFTDFYVFFLKQLLVSSILFLSPTKSPSLPFSQTAVPSIKVLHVVFARGRAVAVVLGGSPWAARVGSAEAAQQTSTQKEQHAGRPTDEDTRSQLLLLSLGDKGIVEVSHHDVCGPADGDDHQEAGEQQAHPGHQADLGLGVLVLYAGGEVGPAEQDEEAEAAEHAGDDGHGAGGLQVTGQHQQGVIVLALLLAGALHHTVHPQALLTALLTHTHTQKDVFTFNATIYLYSTTERQIVLFTLMMHCCSWTQTVYLIVKISSASFTIMNQWYESKNIIYKNNTLTGGLWVLLPVLL